MQLEKIYKISNEFLKNLTEIIINYKNFTNFWGFVNNFLNKCKKKTEKKNFEKNYENS